MIHRKKNDLHYMYKDATLSVTASGRANSPVIVTRLRIPHKLQASVYDILPPTTAIIGYAMGLRNWQLTDFFLSSVGAQIAVSL